MRLRHLAFALALIAPALAFAAPPDVVVFDVNDAAGRNTGKEIRTEIVEALQAHPEVHVQRLDLWKAAARKKRLKGKAAESPRAIARIAPVSRTEAVLAATVVKKGRGFDVKIHLYDHRGRELWSKTLPLSGKKLGGNAERIAAGVTAAMGVSEPAPPPSPPAGEEAPPSEPSAAEPPPPSTESPPGEPGEPEAMPGERKPVQQKEAEAEQPAPEEEAPRPRRRPVAEDDGEVTKPAEGAEAAGGVPLLRLVVGLPVSWRTYDLEPSQGIPVKYTTETPYGGVAFDLEVDPLRSMGPALAGLGLDAHFSRGFLKSRYVDASGKSVDFGSAEYRIYGDLFYRYSLKPESSFNTQLGARVGYGIHRFAVDPNPILNESSRSMIRAGAEVIQPLVPPYLAARVAALYFPNAAPGSVEKQAYGPNATGRGFELTIGVQGDLSAVLKGLGWVAAFDLVRFADAYSGSGAGGTASESYTGVLAAVAYSY